MSRKWGLVWRVIVALLAVILVGLKAATEVKWISGNAVIEFWVLMAAGLAVFGQSTHGAVQLYRKPRTEKRQKQIEKAVLACLKSIGEDSHIDPFTIGGSVYVFRRRRWWFSKKRRLKRIVRYRLNDYPQESVIAWTDKKGVVGKAATAALRSYVDWISIATDWNSGKALTVDQFSSLTKEERHGFSYDEYRQVASKYMEALAVPIVGSKQNPAVLGVLGIDLPYDEDRVGKPPALNGRRVTQFAYVCAATIQPFIDGD